ncbi:MAG: hypothetical protein NZ853_08495 [Leptospiraceae bacterium]|nr:hypothetical protein [Leptospiraceae bacterium]MDW7976785.1 hypothetical protein [Leptospiraceae bacterium]
MFLFLIPHHVDSQDFVNLWNEELSAHKRVGVLYQYQENKNKPKKGKEQNLTLFAEYRFGFYGFFVAFPYTVKWTPNSQTRGYVDHIRLQNKLHFDFKNFSLLGGLLIDFPRNHGMAGDVPKDIGYIEPYVGFDYRWSKVRLKLSLHWNTQTNTEFKEKRNQEFERTWKFQLSVGYSIQKYWIGLESQYQKLYDPKPFEKELYFVGLGLSRFFENHRLSLVYVLPSKQYAYQSIWKLQWEFWL